jgi:hypothetical protein
MRGTWNPGSKYCSFQKLYFSYSYYYPLIIAKYHSKMSRSGNTSSVNSKNLKQIRSCASEDKSSSDHRFQFVKTTVKRVSLMLDRIRSHGKIIYDHHRSNRVNQKIEIIMAEVGS